MSLTTAHSVVAPSSNSKRIAGAIIIAYALISIVPLLWIFATSFKTPPDSIAYPPKIVFQPSIEGYCNLFTTRTRQTPEYINSLGPATGFCDETVRKRNMVIAGPSNFLPRFINSLIIAFGSTFCAVFLGTLSAYGFSRFKVPLADDLLFFILSTRFMPPIAVAIPIYLMYRELGLSDTPPFIPTIIGEGGQDWPAVAAGTTIFLVPILVFTILLRKQLLRGITFGAVRK
ncbi:carbohydrate ABC transporter permease [Mesorhizobium sp. LNHC229A00]|uniref:carbohydrate ABC transporter permease n=1 Tax=Mesorhizobium sp. LNHC229A00 TaxID=1287240 RepID=UPI0003CEF3C8|nr:carbohydrate ABC transporter permease [Mesorhizobium sp. LNHC229A00]ESY93688.1 sugar ABC transporter permease [Mesorhizobium sp. LNHC229A00]